MPQFKQNDFVRVKAGTKIRNSGTGLPMPKDFGKKLKLIHDPLSNRIINDCDVGFSHDGSHKYHGNCHTHYLEYWVDGEIWNGEKWVKDKTMACIVTSGENSFLKLESVCDNSKTASEVAGKLASVMPNKEIQVWKFQECHTVKYEQFIKDEKVIVNGNKGPIKHNLRDGMAIVEFDSGSSDNQVTVLGLSAYRDNLIPQILSKESVTKLPRQ